MSTHFLHQFSFADNNDADDDDGDGDGDDRLYFGFGTLLCECRQ